MLMLAGIFFLLVIKITRNYSIQLKMPVVNHFFKSTQFKLKKKKVTKSMTWNTLKLGTETGKEVWEINKDNLVHLKVRTKGGYYFL